MFTKILVGLDDSPRQPSVLRQAVEFADRCGGKIYLCRAMQVPTNLPPMVWALETEQFELFLVEHGQRALKRVEAELPRGLVARRWCEIGQPADVLCRLAEENDIDLIVIGSHGYGRIDRLLGTTAAKVVNRAPCTVTVVRARA